MQYSSQFKNIHTTQINHTFTPMQLLCIYDYKSGIYQGEYYKNHRQGKGVFYWYSGQIYIGEWLNDSIQGQGTLYFPYGGNFVGFFNNNKAEGAGILTLLDGSRIAGFWKQGRIDGNFVRYDSESDEWILLNSRNYYNINKQSSNYSYAVSLQQIQNSQYQKQVSQIYENVKQKIDTPYYKQMTERLEGHNLQTSASFSQINFQQNQTINQTTQNINFFNQVSLTEVDKFKIKLQQLDNEIFYHGIVRGSRPDGMGIMFSMNGRFSVRGKFANTKLNGPGRVELENGEIYDGIFRNGIISSGFYYNAKFNSYISGTFRGEGDVKLEIKGKGYPYKLTLENKVKAYPCMMIYKNTSEELIFLVQNDIKLLKMLDISKYIFSANDNSNQNTDQKINSANTFGFDNTVEDSRDGSMGYSQTKQDYLIENNEYNENMLSQFNQKKKNNQSLHQNFDDAFEEFLVGQQLEPAQSRQISQEYYSRQFEKEQESEKILNMEESKQSVYKQKVEISNSNFSSSQHDKEYFKKILLHKINVEGIKELCYEDLQRLNQISEDIDKENLSFRDFKELKSPTQTIEQNAEYYLNKARFLKLKLKLKEETQNQFDENKSQRQNSFSHISSQQATNLKNYKKGEEDEIGLSPEFFQTNDNESIKKYSVAVPNQRNQDSKHVDQQGKSQNKGKNYQLKMDNYLNVSSEFKNNQNQMNQNKQSRNSLLQIQNDILNQRKNSFKKNYKDIQINIQNASFENSPNQQNSQQNDSNTQYSRDQIGFNGQEEYNGENYYYQNKY
ncbi:MORN motif protein (macronuclear) [Tetrahymena thermophila SB210]|uniref:MORN motif protein n=1 Tax=Tetrahymena thermophila (strain SB210) TaxID=312017 RepID=I7MHL2_TETTS|nr:MORN motif protein [Tetrahymena thermophila SB210]EAS03076.2 MORN motif protein [Tetrahymena thermophila SB210]|eukprot:XP_001023321.2 MORN motif protein [Tetrahymena thermophila SB210]